MADMSHRWQIWVIDKPPVLMTQTKYLNRKDVEKLMPGASTNYLAKTNKSDFSRSKKI